MIRNTAPHRLPSLTISCPGGTKRLTAFKSSSRAASCATRGRDGGNLRLRSIFDCGDAAPDLVATCSLTCSSTPYVSHGCVAFAPAVVAFVPRYGRYAEAAANGSILTEKAAERNYPLGRRPYCQVTNSH